MEHFSLRFVGEGGSRSLVQGHHGITASRVAGIVRVQIAPDFTLAHTNINTRPLLDITLIGTQKTSVNNVWMTTELVNDGVSVTDPLEPGLVRDETTNRLRTLLPGTYDVPFSMPLADDLPPSFSSADVTVGYTLAARFRFRETVEDRSVLFLRSISQVVQIRKYHPDHIINLKDVMSKRPSSPFNEFPRHDSSSSDSSTNSDSVAESGIGQLGRDFLDGVTLSNVGSGDAVQYTVTVPSRSFGPDDPVSANVHIAKLPDGFAVHHVDMVVEAEIVSRVNDAPHISKQLLLKHTDTPKHAAHYWNRDIHARLFHKASTRSASRAASVINDAITPSRPNSSEPVQLTNEPDEDIPTEQPPVFNDLQQRFTVPPDFDQRPLARQRSDLMEALHGLNSTPTPSSPSIQGLSRTASFAQDAGFAAGSSSVFMPWMAARRESRDSGHSSVHDNMMRRTLSGDLRLLSFRSMSTPASRSSLRASVGGINRQPSPLPPIPHSNNNLSGSMLAGENLRVPVLIVRSGSAVSNRGSGLANAPHSPPSAPVYEQRGVASFEITTPEPDTDPDVDEEAVDVNKELHTDAPQTPESCIGDVEAPRLAIQTTQVTEMSTERFNPRYDTYMLPPPSMRPTPILRAVTSHGSAASIFGEAARGDTAPAAEPDDTDSDSVSLNQNPLKSVLDKITGVPAIEEAESTLKPLISFISPTLSVRHTLRIEIVCHKPMPMNMGSRLSYFPVSSSSNGNRGASPSEPELPKKGDFKSFFKRNMTVGFRHRTIVETPVLVHHASGTDRQFLQGYLYGPQGAGQN
ncbi:hypothetical protein HDU78_011677 [Chytriomyces hyalinus]|nr:hypothetical protein HDU78_011677 [Chytriomyces hyalinus]